MREVILSKPDCPIRITADSLEMWPDRPVFALEVKDILKGWVPMIIYPGLMEAMAGWSALISCHEEGLLL